MPLKGSHAWEETTPQLNFKLDEPVYIDDGLPDFVLILIILPVDNQVSKKEWDNLKTPGEKVNAWHE